MSQPLRSDAPSGDDFTLHEAGDAAPAGDVHASPRSQDVAIKQQRVAEFLEDNGYDAVLFTRQDSFAWFTAGGDSSAGVARDAGQVALFVTPDQRCILANNVESGRTFEEEVAGLGFQLKESRWYDPAERLLEDITRGRKVASDSGACGTTNELDKLRRLRINLTELERQRYRLLGCAVSHAVEAACRSARPGESEQEVAGELAHRLLRHGIRPVSMHVAGGDRMSQFRLAIPKDEPIGRRLTISLAAHAYGLCASLTRTVCFGTADQEFLDRHHVCGMIDATYIFFSRPGEIGGDVLRRAQRIYEKTGWPYEWILMPQGGVTAYSPCEVPILPDSPFRFRAGMAVAWTPSVAGARTGDTMLIGDQGFDYLTRPEQWPTVLVSVKGLEIERPSVLVLDV